MTSFLPAGNVIVPSCGWTLVDRSTRRHDRLSIVITRGIQALSLSGGNVRKTMAFFATVAVTISAFSMGQVVAQAEQPNQAHSASASVTPRQPASRCFALGQKYGTGCYAARKRAGSFCFQADHMWFAKTAYSGRNARTVVCQWKNVVTGGKWIVVPASW